MRVQLLPGQLEWGVAQPGQSTRLGSEESEVRILSSQLFVLALAGSKMQDRYMIRTCVVCEQAKDLEHAFECANRIKGVFYYRHQCRECRREIKARRRLRIRQRLDKYKADNRCAHCGFKDPRCLDFHHLRDKEFSLGDIGNNGRSWDSILAEIAKCEILCANCHRVAHADNEC